MHDRYLALVNANYVFSAARHLGDEILFKPDGFIEKRANEVLRKAMELLEHISDVGLFSAIERGIFADIKKAGKAERDWKACSRRAKLTKIRFEARSSTSWG